MQQGVDSQQRAAHSLPTATVIYTNPPQAHNKKEDDGQQRAAHSLPNNMATYAYPLQAHNTQRRGYQTTTSSSLIAIWHGDLHQPSHSKSDNSKKKGCQTTTSSSLIAIWYGDLRLPLQAHNTQNERVPDNDEQLAHRHLARRPTPALSKSDNSKKGGTNNDELYSSPSVTP